MAQKTLEKFFEKLEGENKENNFKQTEIGLIPEDWEVVRLGEVADVKAGQSAPQGEKYFKNGKYPFIRVQHIDNEDYRITNWDLINDAAVKDYRLKLFSKGTIIFPKSGAAVYLEKRAMLPFDSYIVSHLCAINSKNDKLLQKFLFYFLINKKLAKKKAAGYPTLNLSEIKELSIPLPPVEEQCKIVRVLDKIQQAIELQDRIIEQAKRLKKSLMQKLFTEGLYGEEQKETEIGLIPKNWTLVNLGDVFQLKSGKTRPKTILKYPTDKFRYPVFGGNGVLGYSDQYLFEGSTIVIGRVGEYCGIAYPISAKAWITDNALYVVKKKIAYSEYYLANFLNYYNLNKFSKRAGQPVISQGVIYALKIPLPSLEEQKQIAHILSVVDKKIEVEQKRKQVLKALFKTMLHKLMSGEIRLKELEI